MDYRPLSFGKLTFGITEYKGASKKAFKYKKEVDIPVIGDNLSDVLVFNPGIENKYRKEFGLKDKTEIKLINFKVLHSQGKTVYKL